MTFEPEHDPRQCLPKAQVPLLKDLLEGADVEAMVYRHGCLLAAYVEEVSAHFDEVKELLPHEEAIKLVEAVPELLTVGFNVEDRQHNLDCLRAALKAGADIGLHPARVCDMVRHNPNIMLAADAPAISAAIVRWVDMLAESPAPGNGVWYTYGVMPIVAFNDPQLVQRYAFLHECHAEQEHLTFARVMEPDDEQFTELFPDYASWCNSNGVGPGHVEWGPGTHPFEGDVVTFVDEDVYESLDERDEMTVVEYGEDMEGLLDIPRGGLTAFSRNATTGVPWKPYE
uniref:Uncharacterized protein n=3 Tax=Viridiplantae TaxID=33090 RepID=A0A7R9TRL3_9VIRI|mmetsp:Transcript_5452/g.21515  ORF Transcript_5452/g.21515 Transcript_5452/m.21515 type:complete len:285 (+) Transcript_5452:124-978(+)